MSATKRPAEVATNSTPSKVGKWDDSGDSTLDGRMRVYVRVRPPNAHEVDKYPCVVEPIDDHMLVFDPIVEEEEYFYQQKIYKEPGRKTNKNIQFYFDRVFDEETCNTEVYEVVSKKLIQNFLDGYNCAVFAYGATGSGKTHTMLGTSEDPGVIFFTTMELFRLIEEKKEEDEHLELKISYIEIYNEQVVDLLPVEGVGAKPLNVREDPKRGVMVTNLAPRTPADAQELLDMLESGNSRRTQHPTDANAESSRSHAIFQIYLSKHDYSSSQEMSIQLSKMSLIDLAGSERASMAYKHNRNKKVQREGSNINKSLLALGNCINALAKRDPKKKTSQHIPYRDSKLTLLLKDSLGGSCHTAMIAAVGPTLLTYDDTHNTLTYAKRASGIQMNLKKNTVAAPLQPRNYTDAIETMSKKVNVLTEENHFLKSELNRLKTKMSTIPRNPVVVNENSWTAFNEVHGELELYFREKIKLRQRFLEAESNMKKLDLSLMLRKIELERLETLGVEINEKDSVGSLHCKKLHYIDLKSQAELQLKENESLINQAEKQLRSQCGDKDWFITAYFKVKNSEVEAKDRSFLEKHAVEISKILVSRLESNEETILEQESLLKFIHQLLSGMNRLSDDLDMRFTAVRRKVEGKKSVIWRDTPAVPLIKSFTRHELENVYNLNIFRSTPLSPKRSRKSRQLTSICVTPSIDSSSSPFSDGDNSCPPSPHPTTPKQEDNAEDAEAHLPKESPLNSTFTLEKPNVSKFENLYSPKIERTPIKHLPSVCETPEVDSSSHFLSTSTPTFPSSSLSYDY